MLFKELRPRFSRREGNIQDPSTIFRAEIVNIHGDRRFQSIDNPKTEWPGGLQPELSFSTEIASENLPKEIREVLDLQGNPGALKMCFGLRSITDPENGADKIFLYLAKKGDERAIVMSAQLNERYEWDMKSRVYTQEGKSSSSSFKASVFAQTAKLARKCAELELHSK